MVYLTWSEGFRIGGANPLRPSSILPDQFSSDVVTNLEVGAKTEWLGNRLRLNVSAYVMDWEDFALQIEDPQPGIFALGYVNLPTADIPGVEAELAFAVNDMWQIEGSLAWNDGHVSEDTVLSFANNDGEVFDLTVEEGARLPLSADWSGSLGIEWRSRGTLMDAQPFARLDLAYVGKMVTSLAGIESIVGAGRVERLDSYETGDFRIGLEGERWSTSLFVDNVWDERAITFRSNRWDIRRFTMLRPRTIGVQFRYDF